MTSGLADAVSDAANSGSARPGAPPHLGRLERAGDFAGRRAALGVGAVGHVLDQDVVVQPVAQEAEPLVVDRRRSIVRVVVEAAVPLVHAGDDVAMFQFFLPNLGVVANG